jgi:DNA polymerase-3 subunit alpha
MGVKAHYSYADRKNGRESISYPHSDLRGALAPILDETYGVIVYQEQVIQAAQILAGYSVGQADMLRRAMGKKKKEVLDKEFVPFSEGMRSKGYSEAAIAALWETLVPFADYAFNRAHAAAYGLISYWTAYLKAHYPAEYMAAVLTGEVGKAPEHDSTAVYLAECRRMGIDVVAPSVNVSGASYTPSGGSILHGLGAVKGVGVAGEAIVRERDVNGSYASLVDLLARVGTRIMNKRVIEALSEAGALDCFGPRAKVLETYERVTETVSDLGKRAAYGQRTLFGNGLVLISS